MPYMTKLMEKIIEADMMPGVTQVFIQHDDDCSIFTNKSCNCDPEIEVIRE